MLLLCFLTQQFYLPISLNGKNQQLKPTSKNTFYYLCRRVIDSIVDLHALVVEW